ncbi:MAG: hypothetical protein AB7L90_20495 [Hyphomicrobiaceae bacterium]
MSAKPFPTDRRMLAAQMCHLLAYSAEDPNISLEHLGKAARQIAEFLLSDEVDQEAFGGTPRLRVIQGGRQQPGA